MTESLNDCAWCGKDKYHHPSCPKALIPAREGIVVGDFFISAGVSNSSRICITRPDGEGGEFDK